MYLPCVVVCSSAESQLIAAVNAVWILHVCCALVASRSLLIECINTKCQLLVVADAAIVETKRPGKRIIVVKIIW